MQTNNSVHIKNLPHVADINTLLKLLSNLGAKCDFHDDKVVVDTSTLTQTKATYDIVKTMRASILVRSEERRVGKECRL